MSSDSIGTLTPLGSRAVPRFTYQRTPSALMPMPTLPERIVLPQPGIRDVFDIEIACDDQAEAAAFSVRWQVYCDELGFEPADRFPEQQEHDRADLRSVQVIARHRASGRAVGCFRLLMADPVAPTAPFHVEEVCTSIAYGAIPDQPEARLGCAELSRFCIVAPFRRFDAATEAPPWGIDPAVWAAEAVHRRGLAGLMWLAAAHISVSLRLDYLLTLMEPRLQLLGRSMGFNFSPIGAPVEFRGQRVPYRIDRRALRSLLTVPQTAALMAPITGGLDAGIRRHPMLASYLSARTSKFSR